MNWTEAEYTAYLTRQHRQPPHTATSSGDLSEAALLAQVRALAKRLGYLKHEIGQGLSSLLHAVEGDDADPD